MEKTKYKIGDIIDKRPDGSYIYMSHKGVLNLDTPSELRQAKEEDARYLASLESFLSH